MPWKVQVADWLNGRIRLAKTNGQIPLICNTPESFIFITSNNIYIY
ncbi:hypothetical protein E2320_020589, partial [Naja naja]